MKTLSTQHSALSTQHSALSTFFVWRALAAATAFLAFSAGCDSGGSLVPVRGKVAYKGVPLPYGTIVFTPDAGHGNSGPLASAEIQTDGTYALRTGEALGAKVGWHRVTVVAIDPGAGAEANGSAQARRFSLPRSLVPQKYRDPELSGLTCEIKPGRENGINFNLE